ncbi:MAG: flagellar biosynthesis anti-sigma factor FlgM [Armatimonadota bacterium]
MLVQSKRVDGVLGVHMCKVYKAPGVNASTGLNQNDLVSISKFSQLVERGRAHALLLPAMREELVNKVREALLSGERPTSEKVAAEMIMGASRSRELRI